MTHYVEFCAEDVSVNVFLAFVFYLFNLKILSSICNLPSMLYTIYLYLSFVFL